MVIYVLIVFFNRWCVYYIRIPTIKRENRENVLYLRLIRFDK